MTHRPRLNYSYYVLNDVGAKTYSRHLIRADRNMDMRNLFTTKLNSDLNGPAWWNRSIAQCPVDVNPALLHTRADAPSDKKSTLQHVNYVLIRYRHAQPLSWIKMVSRDNTGSNVTEALRCLQSKLHGGIQLTQQSGAVGLGLGLGLTATALHHHFNQNHEKYPSPKTVASPLPAPLTTRQINLNNISFNSLSTIRNERLVATCTPQYDCTRLNKKHIPIRDDGITSVWDVNEDFGKDKVVIKEQIGLCYTWLVEMKCCNILQYSNISPKIHQFYYCVNPQNLETVRNENVTYGYVVDKTNMTLSEFLTTCSQPQLVNVGSQIFDRLKSLDVYNILHRNFTCDNIVINLLKQNNPIVLITEFTRAYLETDSSTISNFYADDDADDGLSIFQPNYTWFYTQMVKQLHAYNQMSPSNVTLINNLHTLLEQVKHLKEADATKQEHGTIMRQAALELRAGENSLQDKVAINKAFKDSKHVAPKKTKGAKVATAAKVVAAAVLGRTVLAHGHAWVINQIIREQLNSSSTKLIRDYLRGELFLNSTLLRQGCTAQLNGTEVHKTTGDRMVDYLQQDNFSTTIYNDIIKVSKSSYLPQNVFSTTNPTVIIKESTSSYTFLNEIEILERLNNITPKFVPSIYDAYVCFPTDENSALDTVPTYGYVMEKLDQHWIEYTKNILSDAQSQNIADQLVYILTSLNELEIVQTNLNFNNFMIKHKQGSSLPTLYMINFENAFDKTTQETRDSHVIYKNPYKSIDLDEEEKHYGHYVYLIQLIPNLRAYLPKPKHVAFNNWDEFLKTHAKIRTVSYNERTILDKVLSALLAQPQPTRALTTYAPMRK